MVFENTGLDVFMYVHANWRSQKQRHASAVSTSKAALNATLLEKDAARQEGSLRQEEGNCSRVAET